MLKANLPYIINASKHHTVAVNTPSRACLNVFIEQAHKLNIPITVSYEYSYQGRLCFRVKNGFVCGRGSIDTYTGYTPWGEVEIVEFSDKIISELV